MNPRRACLFCNSIDGKITKEDVVPQWIRRLPEQTPVGISRYININVDDNGFDFRAAANPKNPGPHATCVCATCNNGWMSTLESQVKEICKRLIDCDRTEVVELSASEREALAVWATKTAIMFDETVLKKVRRLGREEANIVFETRKPLPFSRIWLAQTANAYTSFRLFRPNTQRTESGFNRVSAASPDTNYWLTFMNFHDLLLIVEDDTSGLSPMRPPVPPDARISLWPTSSEESESAWPLPARTSDTFADPERWLAD